MHRLSQSDLSLADTMNLIRLGKFLGVELDRGFFNSEGQFRHALVLAICRKEKQLAKGSSVDRIKIE
jgi:hypothetical protein